MPSADFAHRCDCYWITLDWLVRGDNGVSRPAQFIESLHKWEKQEDSLKLMTQLNLKTDLLKALSVISASIDLLI